MQAIEDHGIQQVFLERWKMTPLLKIYCHCCGKIFHICRCCYSGHVYCSKECRKAGYRQVRKEAQKKYRKTDAGRKKHREAEQNRRNKKREIKCTANVITKTCMCILMALASIFVKGENGGNKAAKCNFCGKHVESAEEFPERGYGNPGLTFSTPCFKAGWKWRKFKADIFCGIFKASRKRKWTK